MTPRIGSLCSGYGGLEMGLQQVVGGTVAWHAEYDAAPSRVLAERFPGVPNLGDITTTDWAALEPVDWLTAGYPCQPFSQAGKRKGTEDERHLWPYVAGAVRVLRPRHLLFENVRGHVRLGLDGVLADLAGLGYVGCWGVLRASDAGAPHGRARVFVVAADASGEGWGRARGAVGGGAEGGWASSRPARGDRRSPTHASSDGRDEGRPEPAGLVGGSDAAVSGDAPADTDGCGCEGCAEHGPQRRLADKRSQRRQASPDADCGGCEVGAEQYGHTTPDPVVPGACGGHADGCSGAAAWGQYGPAVARWERVLGRPAPVPTVLGAKGQPRLSARAVEWLMGVPDGWVTDVPGLSRNAQLKILGNGVVPQQAALAVRTLLPLFEASAVAA